MSWRWMLLVPLLVASCGGDDDTASTVGPTLVPPMSTSRPSPVPTLSTASTLPAASAPSITDPVGIVPEGFATQGAEITTADGAVCVVCLWVAATPEQRTRGLMGVTDLGGADGMVFLFDGPTQGAFWMRDTPTPLSIAFFAADGSFVSAADMLPCLDGPAADCPRYGAAGPYTAAIEVGAGGLVDLGIADGSRLELLGAPCDPSSP